ncbi:phage major capsid protein [Clostridium perfringens]
MSKELRELLNQLEKENERLNNLINKENVSKEELEEVSANIDSLEARIKAQKKKDEGFGDVNFDDMQQLKGTKDTINSNLKLVNKGDSFFNATIKNNENDNLSIGKYVKGMLTGDWENAASEKATYRELTTSTGKTLIPQELSAQIIDLARPQMALGDIPILPMESNNMTIARIEKDPVFQFKEELAKAEFSDMSFGSVELKSRTIYGLMKISLELLNSAKNIDQVIQQAMANSIAQSIDTVGLYGDGQLQPKGILTYEDINIISSDDIETSKYKSFVKGIGSITKANGTPTTISYNSNIDTSLSLLTDTTGQPLNMPKKVEGLQHKVSNNMKDNQAMVYDNNSIVMGLQNKIIIDTSSELGFEDGSVWLRVYAMLDFAILKPKSITRIDYTVKQ